MTGSPEATSRGRRAARTALGIVVTAAAAAALAAAALVPWPTAAREPLAVTALPEPTASLVSCAGPVLAVGRDATDASQLTDAEGQDVAAATASVELDAAASRLAAPDVSGGAGPDALSAAPHDGVRTDLAAAGSSSVVDDDLRGFAASACAPPLMQSWLVGGSGLTGASDLVLLANPSGVASQVALTVYGAEGPYQPAAAAGIVVPPRTQRVLPLAALALGEESPVIRINATGAPIQASLQTSITRTLLPGGVDQVGTTAAPATTQVIPSVTVVVEPGEDGASEPATTLRLLAPSSDTDATVELTPIAGGAAASESVSLTSGTPAEVELGGLEPGSYRVRVSAAEPVVTALWTTTGFASGVDFAWHTAPSVLSVPSLVAVATGPSPVLTISNEGDEDSVVKLTGGPGAGDHAVPAGEVIRISVQDESVYQLETAGGRIRANVTFSGDGALAGYDVIPADAAAEPVVVYTQ
jgi:hypothetical protein